MTRLRCFGHFELPEAPFLCRPGQGMIMIGPLGPLIATIPQTANNLADPRAARAGLRLTLPTSHHAQIGI